MFGRSTIINADPAKFDEGVRIYREEVIPAVQGQPGFKGGFSMSDRSSGRSISITFWETEDDMRNSEAAANSIRSESVAKLGITEPPTVERMEVTYYDVKAPVGSAG
jgi:heme-degrading monooxygenase HmoA